MPNAEGIYTIREFFGSHYPGVKILEVVLPGGVVETGGNNDEKIDQGKVDILSPNPAEASNGSQAAYL